MIFFQKWKKKKMKARPLNEKRARYICECVLCLNRWNVLCSDEHRMCLFESWIWTQGQFPDPFLDKHLTTDEGLSLLILIIFAVFPYAKDSICWKCSVFLINYFFGLSFVTLKWELKDAVHLTSTANQSILGNYISDHYKI